MSDTLKNSFTLDNASEKEVFARMVRRIPIIPMLRQKIIKIIY